MTTYGKNIAIGNDITVLGNSTFGIDNTDNFLVNCVSTFNTDLTTIGINDRNSISSTGNLTCNDIVCENINGNILLSPTIADTTLTETTTSSNINITETITANTGVKLPTNGYTPTGEKLGRFHFVSFGSSPQVLNRTLTSGNIQNVASLSLDNGIYAIYTRATIGRTIAGDNTVTKIEHSLNTINGNTIENPSSFSDIFINSTKGNNYTLSNMQVVNVNTGNQTFYFNIRTYHFGDELILLGTGTYGSMSAIRIG